VDSDRALIAIRYLGTFDPMFLWMTRIFMLFSTVVLACGFVALIWWPWWVPLVTSFVAVSTFRGSKLTCADFVRDTVISHPEAIAPLREAGVIREDMPACAAPE
jgi:hypothetical protein